ncbi:hypothetical protein Vretifemale_14929 [Volvox reticuliferus]|uniref:Malic enzyme n=1 Tax=Volvox reticuliferus TaxID=1737510 RepID=A0A8J4FS46_9CHLO|nr:hypothetical protein Vretifemale_14929 [Volvox reticuliferus]
MRKDPSPHLRNASRWPSQLALFYTQYSSFVRDSDRCQLIICSQGMSFPPEERERLRLRGLLPPGHLDMDLQKQRLMEEYLRPLAMVPPEDSRLGGVTSEMARRWALLQALQDRNETLFYSILTQHFVEMAPIIYTPTVGWVCANYHKLYRRPRGMYFSSEDRGNMAAMAYNWPQDDVHAIVVTDGSRILGLGDLGVNGLGIPIGKLDLYCAAGGFSPSHVLPVVVDVGTDNEALRQDPLYAGLRSSRLTGPDYYRVMDEFVAAVMSRWPRAVLQFEDFSSQHAASLLERYRHHHCVFNDDIQGTAATALAGLYGALRVMGKPYSELAEQRVVVVGAGSAGMGVVQLVAAAMEKHGLSPSEAASRFWMLDRKGLITTRRPGLQPHVRGFARVEQSEDGQSLLEVVERVHPTMLVGLSGAGGIFTEQVVRTLDRHCSHQRPVIFPMSNPTASMECTAEQALTWTEGRAIFAGGSPQPPVRLPGGGEPRPVAQANNMYLFPGIALGAFIGRTGIINEDMLMTVAEALPNMISEEGLRQGLVYPRLEDIRAISARIALELCVTAHRSGHLNGPAREALAADGGGVGGFSSSRGVGEGEKSLLNFIVRSMFWPEYKSLVLLPRGVGE